MGRIEKLVAKLLAFPTDMRFTEVRIVLEAYGYALDRTRGSHHMFVKRGAPRIDVVVHDKRVKVEYLQGRRRKAGPDRGGLSMADPERTEKTLAYYLSLPYRIEVRPMEGGGFYARYPDLVTPHGDGPTPADAIEDANVSKELFFESCLAHGDPIREPGDEEGFSGKFLVRGPRSLHRKLVERAAEEGVSLNQLVVALLSSSMRFDDAGPPTPPTRAASRAAPRR